MPRDGEFTTGEPSPRFKLVGHKAVDPSTLTVAEFLNRCKVRGWYFTFHWVTKRLKELGNA